ncbi:MULTISPECIES: hypothetical protein [Pseudomonas syringae group]|nr:MULTISPECIES: hypothetical protein [Pseudomonas syringae group]QQN27123.1 hypothetical protein JHZ65_26680 [Pseudomonas syringae pv. maculicola]
MGNLPHFEKAFGEQGLVIPLYSNRLTLDPAYKEITETPDPSDQRIEEILSRVYPPGHMAAMVVNRYPNVPFISKYQVTIRESVEAHFLGLDHVAVAGIIPVIEGVGRKLARSKGLEHKYIKQTFTNLTAHSIADVVANQLGDFRAIESVLNSFLTFLQKYFYRDSHNFPLSDKTNRHGITHGSFDDQDFGTPLNFYKTIGVLDVLCLISDFQVFPARSTPSSEVLALYYLTLKDNKSRMLQGYEEFLFGSEPPR